MANKHAEYVVQAYWAGCEIISKSNVNRARVNIIDEQWLISTTTITNDELKTNDEQWLILTRILITIGYLSTSSNV